MMFQMIVFMQQKKTNHRVRENRSAGQQWISSVSNAMLGKAPHSRETADNQQWNKPGKNKM